MKDFHYSIAFQSVIFIFACVGSVMVTGLEQDWSSYIHFYTDTLGKGVNLFLSPLSMVCMLYNHVKDYSAQLTVTWVLWTL